MTTRSVSVSKIGTQRRKRRAPRGANLRMAQDDKRLPGTADGDIDQVSFAFHPGGSLSGNPRRQHRRHHNRVAFATLEAMRRAAAEVARCQPFFPQMLVEARRAVDQRRLRSERSDHADGSASSPQQCGDLLHGPFRLRNVVPARGRSPVCPPRHIDPPDAAPASRHPGYVGQDGECALIELVIEPAGNVRVTTVVLVEHGWPLRICFEDMGEGKVCGTLLVVRSAAGEVIVVEPFTRGHLPQERIREGDDGRQLVRVTDHCESLRPIRERQRGSQTALAGLVDDHQVEEPAFEAKTPLHRQRRAGPPASVPKAIPDCLRQRVASQAGASQCGERLLAVSETGPDRVSRRRHARGGPVAVGALQAGCGVSNARFRHRQLVHLGGSCLIEGCPTREVVE